ncbi:hypothetical protein ABPG74_008939 [Tetrahymena malaccensis]
MTDTSNISDFKSLIMNSVSRSLNTIFLSKASFCQTKQRLNPLVLSGASGAGKGTLYGMLKNRNPNLFDLSVSCTTRKPRVGEVHGVHYYFMNHEEFQKEIDQDNFAEHCLVHGNFYGTLQKQVFSFMDKGKICVLDIDVQGAEKVHKKFPSWNYVFINVPSLKILEQRLRGRGTETEQQIQTRLTNALKEIDSKNRLGFYHEILNDTQEQAYNDLTAYLKKQYPGVPIN